MAYLLHYELRFIRIETSDEGEVPVDCFQPKTVYATDADYDKQMAFAKAEAYNGNIIVEEVPQLKEEQIAELKAQLTATDYKIIKCSEASLVGEELPYDIITLHAERQVIRDKINELEGSNV